MGERERNTQGGGGIVVAGVCDVFSEGGGGGIVGVFPHGSGPCLACATRKQGARVCSKGGGGFGGVICGQEQMRKRGKVVSLHVVCPSFLHLSFFCFPPL